MEESHILSSICVLYQGEKEERNLDLKHELLKETSYTHLREGGLRRGVVVWDIGCGNGAMTEYLAVVVGEGGKVFALDVSDVQVEIARERLYGKGYDNVHFVVGDIQNFHMNEYPPADVVFGRFVLMHLQYPEQAIGCMADLLRPGGRLCLHESDMRAMEEIDTDPSIREFYRLIVAYGDQNGVDYGMGGYLKEMCGKIGALGGVRVESKVLPTNQLIKTLLLKRTDELEQRFVESSLISEENYAILKKKAQNFILSMNSDFNVLLNPQVLVTAEKL